MKENVQKMHLRIEKHTNFSNPKISENIRINMIAVVLHIVYLNKNRQVVIGISS